MNHPNSCYKEKQDKELDIPACKGHAIEGSTASTTFNVPSKTYPIGDVLNWIERDGYWNADTAAPSVVLALLVYLYGEGVYENIDVEERRRKIEHLITPLGGNRKGLMQLVKSSHDDKMMTDEKAFNAYFNFATTVRSLFGHSGAKGGFPHEAYLWCQGSNHRCYILAACCWLTMKLQRDCGDIISPLDIGFIARQYVFATTY